ncbi:MAG: ABC transporter ATP-binding protein [Rubripirellula sp.]
MTDPIVDVRDLRKTYKGWSVRGRRNVDALQGVSLQAQAGDVFGLLGPNGAGKTTLIKTLLGVVKPSGGTASLFGQPVGSNAARQRVGYLPESLRVDRHHTARTALHFYGRLSQMNSADIARRTDELLELVGLRGRDRESVRRFSKGMYQRLGLAQALMHDPDLLVLDEPTDGLDPVGRNEVRKVIERLRDLGKTIFLNSHILQEVELVCTRVAIMAGGKLLAIGPIDELASPTDAANVFVDIRFAVGDGDSMASGPSLSDQLALDLAVADSTTLSVVEKASGTATHRIMLSTPDQTEVDRVVDQLRQHGHSIVRLENKRPSLEDTFMRLVDQN